MCFLKTRQKWGESRGGHDWLHRNPCIRKGKITLLKKKNSLLTLSRRFYYQEKWNDQRFQL